MAMAETTISDEKLVTVLQGYLASLQRRSSAEEMLERVVTPDFKVGFAGGRVWSGADGLAAYIAGRSAFFDERNVIDELLKREDLSPDEIEAHTSLHFFFRSWEPPAPSSREYTGRCFHVWRLRRDGFDWRVACQLIERLADLNPNAESLFSASAGGSTADHPREEA